MTGKDATEWADTVRAERERQASKGYDAAHDREHGATHLLNWAIDYARRGEAVKSSALILAAMDLLAEREPVVVDDGEQWTEYRSAVVYLDEQGGVQNVRETYQTRRSAEAAMDDVRNEWPDLDRDDDEPPVARAIVSRLRRDPGEWSVSLLDPEGQEAPPCCGACPTNDAGEGCMADAS